MRVFRLGLVLVTLSFTFLSFPLWALPAGNVVYTHGDVRVTDAAGGTQSVRRGMAVEAGQTLVTGQGRLQMRMADGGFIALQPNTQFRIDEYNYAGREDGMERSFFNLVKGGIRFITGTIGHRNKQNFRIKTAVATIGIRGSAGRADMCEGGSCGGRPDGLYVTGNQDTLTLQNEKDAVDIEPGETFHTACATCDIEQVDYAPDAYAAVQSGGETEDDEDEGADETAADEDEGEGQWAGVDDTLGELSAGTIAAGEERNADGEIEVLPEAPVTPTATSKPIGIAYHEQLSAGIYGSGVAAWADDGSTGNFYTLGANGAPDTGQGTNVGGSNPGATVTFNTKAATLAEQGSNATYAVAWARWSGNWSATVNATNVNPVGSMHAIYATALPTVSVPVTGTATYNNLIGGTTPTIVSSVGTTTGTLSAMTMNVNFDTNQVTSTMSGSFLDVFGTASFNASGSGSLNTPDRAGGHFDLSGSCTGGVCSYLGVSSLIGGSEFGIVGSGATGAAGAYDLRDSTTNKLGITGTYLITQ